jgi:hypothetical protein
MLAPQVSQHDGLEFFLENDTCAVRLVAVPLCETVYVWVPVLNPTEGQSE